MPVRASFNLRRAAYYMDFPLSWRRIILFLVLGVTIATVLGFGGVYSYIWVPADLILFSAFLLVLWLSVWHGYRLPWDPIILPMLSFGALTAAQWLFHWSVYPGNTLTLDIQLAGCGCIFYLSFLAISAPGLLQRASWILWLFCGGLAFEAICQFFNADKYIYWFHNATYATPVGPFVYHNYFAGCMDLLLPLSIAVAVRKHSSLDPDWVIWLRRGLVPALAVASMVISQSRGGILSLGFELCLAAVLFWPDLRRKRALRIVAMGGLLFLLGMGYIANSGIIFSRFANLTHHDASLLDRERVAISCWHIFLDHPWLGTGFNTFATVYPAYQTFDSGKIFLEAHNEYAQMLAETGIVGTLCVLVFLALWIYALVRLRNTSPGPLRQLQLAMGIGASGFLFHSYGDFQFHCPGNAMLFYIFVAMVLAPASTRNASNMHPLPIFRKKLSYPQPLLHSRN